MTAGFDEQVVRVLREIQGYPPHRRHYGRSGVLAGDIARAGLLFERQPRIGTVIAALIRLRDAGRVEKHGQFWRTGSTAGHEGGL